MTLKLNHPKTKLKNNFLQALRWCKEKIGIYIKKLVLFGHILRGTGVSEILKYSSRQLLSKLNKIISNSCYNLKFDIDQENYNCYQPNWLNEIFSNPPSNKDLRLLFTKHFSHIELYHACSPAKLTPYYENGLKLLDNKRIEGEFKELVTSKIEDYDICDINCSIEKTRKFYNNTRRVSSGENICFHYDKRHALSQPSFSRYGGEYMHYLVNNYPIEEIRKKLNSICNNEGIPTLIIIQLPLKKIKNDECFKKYIKELLVRWASRYVYKEHLNNDINDVSVITYTCNENIERRYISRHEHPQEFCVNREEFYCDKCKKRISRK